MDISKLKNKELKEWLQGWIDLCTPDEVVFCDGSKEQYDEIANVMVKAGVFIRLDEDKKPNSYAVRSDVGDVARVEERTYICSEKREDAGPSNNWCDPAEMRSVLCNGENPLYKGCMKGRTMYIIPFSMGPIDSPISKYGIEITDSGYVVCNMNIMTRVSSKILERIDNGTEFVKCIHSVGAPLEPGEADVPWPCNAEHKYITHFPETREILSRIGYGGNALLVKCFALPVSVQTRRGWMAEHIYPAQPNPEGVVKYITVLPLSLRQTNLAMMEPTIEAGRLKRSVTILPG